ncbi:MAG: ribonuclease HII [Candidatus Buchananbacteria bacterium RIFCSPHIGHO2_01_FULL_46_12]|uniref:Ribonuclease HII n=2 Tax=Candidatus Buchananiibacteriota TaxID=1817903 RepID=A0A1G1YKG0_9BACT|nr:MAG: ribonuclease HII [Candidatus Buchananbacteria bacterium RIFCSPHIGHO2_01_FULL_46_12]OGY52832.1 MAG: ribonuclease HII [Candidatus Buchananbacteria bacterium RIFCSPLOWO2_01_FULL_45_31]
MRYPNYSHENKILSQGFTLIAGLDEAGRGAWAGPIVAGAVILNPEVKIRGLKDSKLLCTKAREELFAEIAAKALGWAAGIISEKKIDQQGLGWANLAAMRLALKNLSPQPDHLLIDAVKLNYENLPSLSIIDGDYKITSIAAASIVAKVTRDRLMIELHEKYPEYNFDRHKGYGTAGHYQMIFRHGLCALHRRSFRPMRNLGHQ